MPKMTTPHGASWRGLVLAPGETIEVSDAEAFQLAAHGFVLAETPINAVRDARADIAEMARPALLRFLGGRGLGNLFRKPTEELRALAIDICDGKFHAPKEPCDGRE
jgi:hypothetical protein